MNHRRVIFAAYCGLLLVASAATTIIPGPLSRHAVQSGANFPKDDFESYTADALVNGLSGGSQWDGPYRVSGPDIYDLDDLESYSDGAALDALSGGNYGWSAAFVDRESPYGIKASDNLESYSDGAALDALNGGSDWGGAFVDR